MHQIALKCETLHVDVCVPKEDDIHTITNRTVHEELLNEYPHDKLHTAMRDDISMVRDFEVAT